ncbi:MAG TPA: hypothetical protein VGF94_06410 [Kofleriaceae bacterium]
MPAAAGDPADAIAGASVFETELTWTTWLSSFGPANARSGGGREPSNDSSP